MNNIKKEGSIEIKVHQDYTPPIIQLNKPITIKICKITI